MATIQFGKLVLTESENYPQITDNNAVLQINGAETVTGGTNPVVAPLVKKIHLDFISLVSLFIPVVFTNKTEYNGYYIVQEATDSIEHLNQGVAVITWQLKLLRVGETQEVDIESRINGPQTRTNANSTTGTRWHAPPIGATAYYTGATQPSSVNRTGTDGTVTTYIGIPLGTYPRYAIGPVSYALGRCRFFDNTQRERVGIGFENSATGWAIDNSLVRMDITPGSGVIEVGCYTPALGMYAFKDWDIRVNGVSLGQNPVSCGLLRNDYECVSIRVTWNLTPSGRTQVDFTLRRGSRFIEAYVQTSYSTTIAFYRGQVEAAIQGASPYAGTLRASVNDVAGNRYVVGSMLAPTVDLANGGISVASTTTMDAFIGAEAGGSGAVTNDTASTLTTQYVGAATERVVGYRR